MMVRELSGGVVVRSLAGSRELAQCIELQALTWGDDFRGIVQLEILQVVQKIGGVVAGAVAPDGRVLGFVFGISGIRHGRLGHWSHMLAVRPEARTLGLGRELKLLQRELLLELGIPVMYWSYDPLVARNANLNLNRLGARPSQYVRNMYGEDTGSSLHAIGGTDRFIVSWDLAAPAVLAAIAGQGGTPSPLPLEDDTPIVSLVAGGGEAGVALPRAGRVWVEVPRDVERLKDEDRATAVRWRVLTRRAFEHYLAASGATGAVTGMAFDRTGTRAFYLIEGAS